MYVDIIVICNKSKWFDLQLYNRLGVDVLVYCVSWITKKCTMNRIRMIHVFKKKKKVKNVDIL